MALRDDPKMRLHLEAAEPTLAERLEQQRQKHETPRSTPPRSRQATTPGSE